MSTPGLRSALSAALQAGHVGDTLAKLIRCNSADQATLKASAEDFRRAVTDMHEGFHEQVRFDPAAQLVEVGERLAAFCQVLQQQGRLYLMAELDLGYVRKNFRFDLSAEAAAAAGALGDQLLATAMSGSPVGGDLRHSWHDAVSAKNATGRDIILSGLRYLSVLLAALVRNYHCPAQARDDRELVDLAMGLRERFARMPTWDVSTLARVDFDLFVLDQELGYRRISLDRPRIAEGYSDSVEAATGKLEKILDRLGELPVPAKRDTPAARKPDAAPWPEFLTAGDLAESLGKPREAVRKQLERFAEKYPDCRREAEGRRKGEPKWFYRVADVLSELNKE